MRVLSVDVGTSNTVAVLAAHGLEPRVVEVDGAATMPSAVYADEEGVILVGRDAERQARLDPTRFEPNPKRRIDDGVLALGGSVVPVADALAAVLKRVLDETVRQLGGALPDEFRLTYPARWGSPRQNTLLSAARLAGMTGDIVLVPEPVAAAAHFGHRLAPGSSLAVYDLGAGTFDVAVIEVGAQGFTVLASDGLADLGGSDMDHVLLEYLGRQISNRDAAKWQQLLRPESTADSRARRALIEDVRAAKETLSRHPQTEVPMPEPFADVLITRPELEGLVRPSLSRSVELLSTTISASGVRSLAGIFLVGGASRMPLVATLIGERLRIVPASLDQPETAVALGAHLVPRNGVGWRAETSAPLGQPSQPFQQQSGQQAAQQQPVSQPFQLQSQQPAPQQQPVTQQHQQQLSSQPFEQQSGQQAAQQQPVSQPFQQQSATQQHQQQLSSQPFQQQAAQQSPVSQPFQQQGQQSPLPPTAHQQPSLQQPGQQSSQQSPSQYPSTGDFMAAAHFPQMPASQPTSARKGASKATLVSLGAIVVVALLVLGGFLVFGQKGFPSAADCAGQSGSPDAKGFTSCTRQLAGPIADQGDCHGGYDGSGVTVPGLAGSSVTCHTTGQTVVYIQAGSLDEVDVKVRGLMDAYPGDAKVKATWKGNGLSGDYEALASSGVGVVVFTVSDRPLVGVLTAPATSDPTSLTAAKAAGLFERSVQPGT